MLPQYPPIIDSRAEPFGGTKPFQFRLKHLLILVTVIGCGLAFLRAAYMDMIHVETGENLEHVKWLPQSASNVSFYRSYSFTAYEFDISESDFLAWRSWKTVPITNPVSVMRYLFANRPPSLSQNPTAKELEQWDSLCRATVTDGLWYERRQRNGGGVRAAYDRANGRVYVQSSPR